MLTDSHSIKGVDRMHLLDSVLMQWLSLKLFKISCVFISNKLDTAMWWAVTVKPADLQGRAERTTAGEALWGDPGCCTCRPPAPLLPCHPLPHHLEPWAALSAWQMLANLHAQHSKFCLVGVPVATACHRRVHALTVALTTTTYVLWCYAICIPVRCR